MRLITWNINSVRLRIGHVKTLTDQVEPDILCLQETKTPDEHFPADALRDMGYVHQHFHGMKSYNGVAIVSKHPFESTDIHHRVGKEDCRHVAVRVNGLELHNLYIPAGGDEPDPALNDKFAHKLDFVDEMTRWFEDQYSKDQNVVAVGDFNIAPYEQDVWSSKQLQKVVSHTAIEREKLDQMKAALRFVDVAREFIPEDEKAYSWWSYRNRDWKKSNRGRRLDHIWVTEPLKARLKSYETLNAARDWEKPSDHAPVIVDLAS